MGEGPVTTVSGLVSKVHRPVVRPVGGEVGRRTEARLSFLIAELPEPGFGCVNFRYHGLAIEPAQGQPSIAH